MTINANTQAAYDEGCKRQDEYRAEAAFFEYRIAASEGHFEPGIAASVAFVAGIQGRPFPHDDERVQESEMTIKTFNTGRRYTEDGQRIAYTVIDRTPDDIIPEESWHTVSFADFDRMIDGTVRILEDHNGYPTPRQVLQAYDAGGYGYDNDRARVNKLHSAAMHHQENQA